MSAAEVDRLRAELAEVSRQRDEYYVKAKQAEEGRRSWHELAALASAEVHALRAEVERLRAHREATNAEPGPAVPVEETPA